LTTINSKEAFNASRICPHVDMISYFHKIHTNVSRTTGDKRLKMTLILNILENETIFNEIISFLTLFTIGKLDLAICNWTLRPHFLRTLQSKSCVIEG
jgi:hypothetical protein